MIACFATVFSSIRFVTFFRRTSLSFVSTVSRSRAAGIMSSSNMRSNSSIHISPQLPYHRSGGIDSSCPLVFADSVVRFYWNPFLQSSHWVEEWHSAECASFPRRILELVQMTSVDSKPPNMESSEREWLCEKSVRKGTLQLHFVIVMFNEMEGKDDQQTHPLKRW